MDIDAGSVAGLVYELVRRLPVRDYTTLRAALPRNGLYLFFERGESVVMQGTTIPRVVRIGTHTGDGNFRGRIRQHYGQVNSLRGNKNGSVFRKHVGGALIRRDNPSDSRLKQWLTQGVATLPDVEEHVSLCLRQNFTFCCIELDDPIERLASESRLVALFAQHPMSQPSEKWLGHYSASGVIRSTGLWNVQHVDAEALGITEFKALAEQARISVE